MIARGQNVKPALDAVDHLLLGVSDLDRGIDWVEQRTGVRAAPGGVHPGAGTRNALLSLSNAHYLEIIAPDPAQPFHDGQRDLLGLRGPRLITFAAATDDIERTAAAARDAGYRIVGPVDGSRRTLSGETLRWRRLAVSTTFAAAGIDLVPFFIQWAPDSPHPSKTSPAGCELEALRFEHPDDSGLKAVLRKLGIDADVSKAKAARIIASIKTPKGRIELT
jgi:hypothetical protein